MVVSAEHSKFHGEYKVMAKILDKQRYKCSDWGFCKLVTTREYCYANEDIILKENSQPNYQLMKFAYVMMNIVE